MAARRKAIPVLHTMLTSAVAGRAMGRLWAGPPERKTSVVLKAVRRGTLLAGAALVATGCQVVAPSPPPQPRLLVDRAAIGTPVARPAGVELTYTVKRGTIRETVTVPGKVVPARSAHLSFRATGTVYQVHVRSGQEVKRGDPLMELTVDDESLRQARSQAALADLMVEAQEAKVRELRTGATPGALAAARAEVARAEAAVVEARQARQAAQQPVSDDEVRLASLALEQARDDLAVAKAKAGLDQEAAAAAVRAAERRVAAAAVKVEQARSSRTDPRLAQIELEQARDDLTQVQAALERARRGQGAQSGAQGQASADLQDAVRAAQRKLDMETIRYQAAQAALEARRAARAVEASVADLKVQAAQEALAAAQAKLDELQRGAPSDALRREEARLALLREEADALRRMAQPMVTLTAPFDGTVASVDVSPGQAVEARTTVVRLAGQGALSVMASASESDVAQLQRDQKVEVTFPGLGEDVATSGVIVDISEIATQGDRASYPVRVELKGAPPGLKLGMTANVNVYVREAQDVLYVPVGAVRTVDGRVLVTRIDPSGQVADVSVRVGGTYGGNVEVLEGLSEGDVVAAYTSPDRVARPR